MPVNLSLNSDKLPGMFVGMRRSLRIIRTAPGPWRLRLWLFLRNLLTKFFAGAAAVETPGSRDVERKPLRLPAGAIRTTITSAEGHSLRCKGRRVRPAATQRGSTDLHALVLADQLAQMSGIGIRVAGLSKSQHLQPSSSPPLRWSIAVHGHREGMPLCTPSYSRQDMSVSLA